MCTICGDDVTDELTMYMAECGHIFHAKCIATAFRHNPQCPNIIAGMFQTTWIGGTSPLMTSRIDDSSKESSDEEEEQVIIIQQALRVAKDAKRGNTVWHTIFETSVHYT